MCIFGTLNLLIPGPITPKITQIKCYQPLAPSPTYSKRIQDEQKQKGHVYGIVNLSIFI